MGNETAKDITNMIEIGYVNHKTYGWDVHFYEFFVDILRVHGLNIPYIAKQDRPYYILESHCIDFPCSMHLKSMLVCSEIMCDYILEKYKKELLELYVTEKLKTYLIELTETNANSVEIDETFSFSVNTTVQKVQLFEPLIITEATFYQKYFWGFVIIGIMLIVILAMICHHRWNPILKRKKLQMPIKNALTISVTIGHYTPSSNQRQNEIDDELEDLDGIEHDFDHIQDLFVHRLQYEMYPKLFENEYKMIWNEQQLKAFFESKALYLSKNIDN